MEATKTTFADLISQSEKPVLVDFYADWCGPCHSMSPVIQELAVEFSDKLKIVKVNVDKNPAASASYKIISIPTFILFHKGEIKWRESGVISPTSLKKALGKFL